jgi:hypothetical protein
VRVYYVNGYANEVYYVRAEDEEAAEALLRKQIGKFVFQKNLSDDSIEIPEKLGDDIIVEFGISKGTLETDLRFDDITATAYVFSENGMPHWKDWKITVPDVIGDENVAEALQSVLDGNEKDNV